jgi:hypothetical protein
MAGGMKMNYEDDVTIAFEIVLDEIENVTKELKQAGAEAFQKENYNRARTLIEKGEQMKSLRDKVYDLQKEWDNIYSTLTEFTPKEQLPSSVEFPQAIEIPQNAEISPKLKGNLRRKAFVDKLCNLGIKLTNVEGVLYKTETGKLIGIASATESKKWQGRWFLGLPIQNYDHFVLLCEKEDGKMLSFVIPKDFLRNYIQNISQSTKGDYKFHVVRKDGKYCIQIPGIGKLDMSEFLDNIESLRK